MSDYRYLSNEDIYSLAGEVAKQIREDMFSSTKVLNIYGIPRGGIASSYAVLSKLGSDFKLTDDPTHADIFIDDIIDSGNTKNRYLALNPNAKFYALIDKERQPDDSWYVFPWEESAEASIEDAFIRLQQFYNITPDKLENLKQLVCNFVSV